MMKGRGCFSCGGLAAGPGLHGAVEALGHGVHADDEGRALQVFQQQVAGQKGQAFEQAGLDHLAHGLRFGVLGAGGFKGGLHAGFGDLPRRVVQGGQHVVEKEADDDLLAFLGELEFASAGELFVALGNVLGDEAFHELAPEALVHLAGLDEVGELREPRRAEVAHDELLVVVRGQPHGEDHALHAFHQQGLGVAQHGGGLGQGGLVSGGLLLVHAV
jgi:hypothetical protein